MVFHWFLAISVSHADRSLSTSILLFSYFCPSASSYPLILSGIESCSATIRRYLQRSETSVNIAYEMREDSTITSMAMQGLGAAIMPRLAAQPIPPDLKVYSLPVPLERVIKAAIVKNALHSPAVFAFLDTLRKQ